MAEDCAVLADFVLLFAFLSLNQAVSRRGMCTPVHLLVTGVTLILELINQG